MLGSRTRQSAVPEKLCKERLVGAIRCMIRWRTHRNVAQIINIAVVDPLITRTAAYVNVKMPSPNDVEEGAPLLSEDGQSISDLA